MSKTIAFLLVDDDSDDSFLFGEVLKEIDSAVTLRFAVNGEEALEQLRIFEVLPDLIFLDLNMPRMDGKECLIELKKDPQLKQIPVIMYTTSSQSRDIEVSMQNGAICFITKPASMKELKHILSSILNGVRQDTLEEVLRTLGDKVNTFIVY